jgi:hypothetical protein
MFGFKALQKCPSSFTGQGNYQLDVNGVGSWNLWRSVVASGDPVFYYAENEDGTIWEEGWGEFTQGSPDTLSRNLLGSSTGSLIDWQVADAPVYIASVPDAAAMKHMLAPLSDAEPPEWLPPGALWRDTQLEDDGVWIDKVKLDEDEHAEQGRHYITPQIWAASQRTLFVDKGAGNYTFTADDIGKTLCFDTTAAVRVLTMLANNAAGMGHGAYVFVKPYGSSVNGVTFTPGGSDTTDLATAPPGRRTLFMWDGAKSKWVSDYVAPNFPATQPRGRLTLTTLVPLLTGAVSGAGTVYFTPYGGNLVPVWSASLNAFVPTVFAELSNALAESSTGKAGPSAAGNNQNLDLFVWSDAGTPRLTRGPAWSTDKLRGTGAGTTELERVQGFLVNKVAIANGPGAGLGTYVGTIRTNGTATVDFNPGGVAAGGTAAVFGLWNAFNRVKARGFVGDNGNSWAQTNGAVRAANSSSTMRVSRISGQAEDSFWAQYAGVASNSVGARVQAGVCYDSTSVFSGRNVATSTAVNGLLFPTFGDHAVVDEGWGFMQAGEFAENSGTPTWYGDNGGLFQSGMIYELTW